MNKKTTNLVGIILTILGGIFLYFQLCSSCGAIITDNKPIKKTTTPTAPKATSYPFSLKYLDYACNANNNYNFNVSSSNILTPLAADLSNCIGTLKTYLSENPKKTINITGYYKSDETNDSAFPNLGIARANSVKNHFVEMGIPSTQINTFGQLKYEMIPKDTIYYGPVSYRIKMEDIGAADDMQTLFNKIKADPLVLYFDTAETTISLTDAQRQKFAAISRYLDKVVDANCYIVGHTDNSGKAITNKKIGQERADFAKEYLIKNGISEARIKAISKGQTEPVTSNATDSGKAKNRRTVITIN